MKVIPAVAVKLSPAGKVLGAPVPLPEPGVILFGPVGLLTAVFVPLDVRGDSENARVPSAAIERFRRHERSDVYPNAVVQVRFPADRLLVERLPADEDVVGLFALENSLKFRLET